MYLYQIMSEFNAVSSLVLFKLREGLSFLIYLLLHLEMEVSTLSFKGSSLFNKKFYNFQKSQVLNNTYVRQVSKHDRSS